MSSKLTRIALSGLFLTTALTAANGPALAQEVKVSAPGKYEGYAPVLYQGYSRSSVYVPARDGTRLAIDIYRPTLDGKVVDSKLPVVWMHTPYNRRGAEPAVQTYAGDAIRLVQYGYVVATVDFRGVFASFGKNMGYGRGEWSKDAWFDAYDVTEWLAKQPWSTGKIGMWGCSATGGAAMQAAVTAPPSLKAIFDMSSEFEAYMQAAPGGLAPASGPTFQSSPGQAEASVVKATGAAPVDGPDGPRLLAEAIASHKGAVLDQGFIPFRDGRAEDLGLDNWWIRTSPSSYLDVLRKSRIGIYAVATWNERWIRHGAFYTAGNLPDQAKLLVGPQAHCRWDRVRAQQGFDIVKEELRFFDYWLKGVQNGLMSEPRVTYFTYNAPKAEAWRTAPKWPLPTEQRRRLYLGDGILSPVPDRKAKLDVRVVDYATNSVDSLNASVATATNIDEKGMLYATAPLEADLEVTGHPTMSLWLSSTAPEADVLATLEDVAPDGTVTSYQMYGGLRASHRALGKAPFNNFGLPWHNYTKADARPLEPGQPAELQFDLLPMSYLFKKGHQLRLVLTLSDPARTTKLDPAPTITIYTGADHASFLTLPVAVRRPSK